MWLSWKEPLEIHNPRSGNACINIVIIKLEMLNHLQHKPHVAQSYCFKENIFIYPIPLNKKSYKMEVSYKGKVIPSDNIYSKDGVRKKTWELYEYFYNKRDI